MAQAEQNAPQRGQNATGQTGGASTSPPQSSGSTASSGVRGEQATTGRAGSSGGANETERSIPVAEETQGRGARTDVARRRGQYLGGLPITPWGLMRMLMSDDMEQLFGGISGRTDLAPAGRARAGMSPASGTPGPSTFVPDIEVFQDRDAIVVRADLPGMAADDIEVLADDGILTIAGERRQERSDEQGGVIRTERTYGRFERTLPLPDGADADRVMATFRDGVLEIRVPVPQREQGRRVPVQS